MQRESEQANNEALPGGHSTWGAFPRRPVAVRPRPGAARHGGRITRRPAAWRLCGGRECGKSGECAGRSPAGVVQSRAFIRTPGVHLSGHGENRPAPRVIHCAAPSGSPGRRCGMPGGRPAPARAISHVGPLERLTTPGTVRAPEHPPTVLPCRCAGMTIAAAGIWNRTVGRRTGARPRGQPSGPRDRPPDRHPHLGYGLR